MKIPASASAVRPLSSVRIRQASAKLTPVWLLDEPFAALDEITRMALNDDLLRLWESRRATIVFVTHSVFESVYLSTRIAVLSARPGHIVAELAVALPQPRSQAVRTTPGYAALCAAVSSRLGEAINAEPSP
jgi:NitT/TauT family transport system ATP-binding protein